MIATLLPALAMANSAPLDLSATLNTFGVALSKQLSKHDGGAFAFSPTSIHMAFSMLLGGCDEPQRAGLAKALGVGGSTTDLDAAYRTFIGNDDTSLRIANGVWRPGRGQLNPAFVDRLASAYKARASSGLSPSAVQADADQFCDAATKGRIRKLPIKVHADTSLILVNALAFDGVWSAKFPAGLTNRQTFHGRAGETTVAMMHQRPGSWMYAKVGSTQFIRLPYVDSNYSMLVALPDAGAARTFDFSKAVKSLGRRQVVLSLPKFHLTSKFDLIPGMSTLGASDLFRKVSRYPKIFAGGEPSRVDQAVHVADVQVDEDGTKAAAVTAIGMTRAGIMRQTEPPVIFTVDRPFTFAIWDERLHAPVFLGAIDDLKC